MGRRRSVVRRRTDSQGRAVLAEGFEAAESGESEVERLPPSRRAGLLRARGNGDGQQYIKYLTFVILAVVHSGGASTGGQKNEVVMIYRHAMSVRQVNREWLERTRAHVWAQYAGCHVTTLRKQLSEVNKVRAEHRGPAGMRCCAQSQAGSGESVRALFTKCTPQAL